MKLLLRCIIIFLAVLLWVSCTSNTILKKPKDLIKKKEMVALITDLYLAKAMKESGNLNIDIWKKENRDHQMYQWILQKHQIDTGRFENSNYYYCSVMDEYDEIHQKALKNLKDTLQKIMQLDSINKIIKIEEDSRLPPEKLYERENLGIKNDQSKIK